MVNFFDLEHDCQIFVTATSSLMGLIYSLLLYANSTCYEIYNLCDTESAVISSSQPVLMLSSGLIFIINKSSRLK